ncbi:metallophosphoesterase family protein [Gimesia chilikensis]|uniref:metallophosphoesterase family protein n=1 Tax=Gimesia chilikensis TaxID=2605989 RepID=UPI00118B6A33|nr:YfcE family phosphodiesterase [Gimesia chilikensis]MCR9232754.1 YfcE family phosphodiesterase [bacterium]QDT82615.1 phosphodiesterase [Gimesia chilikensis]
MRVLVISDIHSNWAALSSLQEEFDYCLCIGDLVDYGTDPVPCIEWVKQHATACVRGNHDHAVAQRVEAKGSTGFRKLACITRRLHWDLLDRVRMKYLARLPISQQITIEGVTFYLVHGTPRDPLDEYLGENEAGWRSRLQGINANFVCVGHTHLPFHLDLGDKQVINPGSVGQPRDGDPRCSYAIIEDGQVTLKRQEYDIEAAIRQMEAAGLSGESLELGASVLRNGRMTAEASQKE